MWVWPWWSCEPLRKWQCSLSAYSPRTAVQRVFALEAACKAWWCACVSNGSRCPVACPPGLGRHTDDTASQWHRAETKHAQVCSQLKEAQHQQMECVSENAHSHCILLKADNTFSGLCLAAQFMPITKLHVPPSYEAIIARWYNAYKYNSLALCWHAKFMPTSEAIICMYACQSPVWVLCSSYLSLFGSCVVHTYLCLGLV